MEIIVVPSNGKGGLNDDMSSHFGRCSSFTFVTIENNEIIAVKIVPNHAITAQGGVGVQASQIVGTNNANVVIVRELGPNAAQELTSLNLKLVQAPEKHLTIKKVIDLHLKGMLLEINGSNVGPHSGMSNR